MPYYDYKCTKCGHIFEVKKGMNDPLDPKCPRCAAATKRVFSVPYTAGGGNGSCSSCATGGCSSCGGH